MKILPFLTILFLAACATPQTPQQAVYQAQTSYNAAATIAIQYIKLPKCKPASTKLCSKPEVVMKVKKADIFAYNAIKEAQEAVRNPAFTKSTVSMVAISATSAVDAFVKITKDLEVE